MSTLLDRIPEITAASTGVEGRPRTSQPEPTEATWTGVPEVARRTFLRTAVVGGSALAMTMLGWLGERLPAFAVTRTSIAPGNCLGYNTPGGDIPCWGAQLIASTYCASDGYHRTDTVNQGSVIDYYNWRVGCGGYAGWTWHHTNGHGHRCTDGNLREVVVATGNNYYYTTICSKYL
jgi:hypothetical protein